MKLDITQLKSITTGAVRIEQEEDGIHFYRFTQEQQALYAGVSADFLKKTHATSGVKFCFRTNSETFSMKWLAINGSGRTFFQFDVFVNGKRTESFGNFDADTITREYTSFTYPLGGFEKTVSLGAGEKDVCIYFPYSIRAVIQEVSVDDGAWLEPKLPRKKMVVFGDSIAHGYDALRPSNSAFTRLAQALDAQEYNKGIGGDGFFPALAATKEPFDPEYIVVAYGTNNWFGNTYEEFIGKCNGFYQNLVKTYPNSKIFALTPIWRDDCRQEKKFGAFEGVEKGIREAVRDLANVEIITCFDFLPHDKNYLGDFRIHPSDEGFDYYYSNLVKEIIGNQGV